MSSQAPTSQAPSERGPESAASGQATSRPPAQPASAPPTTARTLRQRIEDHPAGLFVGIAIAAATATLGIVLPLAQLTQDSRVASVEAELARVRGEQQLVVDGLRAELEDARRAAQASVAQERATAQARIEELERSLSGITRTLGDGTDTYDVSDLMVEPRRASSVPDSSLFHPGDGFYALDPARATGWTYAVISDLGFTAELMGTTEEAWKARNPLVPEDAWTRFPIHVWYYGDDKLVEFDDPVGGARVSLHPRTMAMLQRVSHDDYLDAQLAQVPADAARTIEVVRAGFARDPAGWVLQDQVVGDVSFFGSLRPRIESLQKRDDIAYGRAESVLPDVTVAGVGLPEYYWSREWLIVDAGEDLFLVKLFVADDDHRSPDYGAVSAWLDGLRIVRT